MKKNIKKIIIICLLFCLLTYVGGKFHDKKEQENKVCSNFELDDIIFKINNVFEKNLIFNEDKNITLYMPVNISNDANYIFARNDTTDEYIFLGKDLNKQDIKELEKYVQLKNDLYPDDQLEINQHNNYVYIIFSNNNFSTIDRIIRSYIYC